MPASARDVSSPRSVLTVRLSFQSGSWSGSPPMMKPFALILSVAMAAACGPDRFETTPADGGSGSTGGGSDAGTGGGGGATDGGTTGGGGGGTTDGGTAGGGGSTDGGTVGGGGPATVIITVQLTGSGAGRVVSSPSGIDCPSACSMTVTA